MNKTFEFCSNPTESTLCVSEVLQGLSTTFYHRSLVVNPYFNEDEGEYRQLSLTL
jgi:hypothetical protein